jgi:hypothetical protein
MHNISLVCTRHAELGKCNSDELYKIFEYINPEVIFEEIPPTFFDRYYIEKSLRNLESDTISRYLENHKIDHIPVDSDDLPSDDFFKDHKYMMERIEGLIDINGFTYKKLSDTNKLYIEEYGFKYLNDISSININDEIYSAIENGLKTINNDKLFQTFKLWKDINDKRENQMLKNIYRYSQAHIYDRAIFTIGAAHRRSIIEKISECQKNEKVKLNWILELSPF